MFNFSIRLRVLLAAPHRCVSGSTLTEDVLLKISQSALLAPPQDMSKALNDLNGILDAVKKVQNFREAKHAEPLVGLLDFFELEPYSSSDSAQQESSVAQRSDLIGVIDSHAVLDSSAVESLKAQANEVLSWKELQKRSKTKENSFYVPAPSHA